MFLLLNTSVLSPALIDRLVGFTTTLRGANRFQAYYEELPVDLVKRSTVAEWASAISNASLRKPNLLAAFDSLGVEIDPKLHTDVLRKRLLAVPGLPFTSDPSVAPSINRTTKKEKAAEKEKVSVIAGIKAVVTEVPISVTKYVRCLIM